MRRISLGNCSIRNIFVSYNKEENIMKKIPLSFFLGIGFVISAFVGGIIKIVSLIKNTKEDKRYIKTLERRNTKLERSLNKASK